MAFEQFPISYYSYVRPTQKGVSQLRHVLHTTHYLWQQMYFWKIMDEGEFSDISVRTWVLTSSRERANP